MRNFLYIVLLYPISVVCQHSYNVDLIPEELIENADAVVRNETISIDIKSQSSYTYAVTKVITVLNKDGERPLTVPYSKSSKIKSLTAYVYDEKGVEVKKLKKKNFNDYSATGQSTFHDDSRVYVYEHPTNSFPYTLSLKFVIEDPNTIFLPRWYPIGSYNQSVEKSSYHISCPEELNLRFLQNNFADSNINITKDGAKHRYRIENLPAKKYEVLSPSLSSMVPTLTAAVDHFHLEGVDGSAKDWNQFGKWYYDNLLAQQRELPQEAISEVKQITASIDDPIDKAKAIYSYVQSRSRYISVQLGIGGWKPDDAASVHKLGYGDCKGLTNYTHALLEQVGIESFYCPVYAGSHILDIKQDFHSMQGNHVILCIPDQKSQDSIWLECTSQENPFGYIGDFTDDRNILVIGPSGGKIQHTTTYNEDNSQLKVEGEAKINADGSLSLSYSKDHSGVYYDRSYIQHSKDKKLRESYISDFNHLGEVSQVDFSHEDHKQNSTFSEQINIDVKGFAQNINDELIFTPNLYPKRISIPDKVRNRKTPFVITRSAGFTDYIMYLAPEGYAIEFVPEDVTLDTEFGLYELKFEKLDERNLKYSRRFVRKKGTYSKDKYKSYRSFLKKVSKLDTQKIVLTKI